MFVVSITQERGPERVEAVENLSWVLRCFMGMQRNIYDLGSPRRIEAEEICKTILKQVRPVLNDREYDVVSKGLFQHENNS